MEISEQLLIVQQSVSCDTFMGTEENRHNWWRNENVLIPILRGYTRSKHVSKTFL